MSALQSPFLGPLANATPGASEIKTFYAATSITAGDWVAPNAASPFSSTSQYGPCGVATTAATANLMAVGVALDTVVGTTAAPVPVRVVVSGYCASAKVNAGVTAGESLSLEATAGSATTASGATFPYCGRALSAPSGGFSAVWVQCG